MPLSKARDRDRKRLERAKAVQPNSNLSVAQPVQPKHTIAGLKIEGNRILGCTNKAVKPTETIPIYNPAVHKAGDRVLVKPLYGKKLVEAVIPERDADGQLIPDY